MNNELRARLLLRQLKKERRRASREWNRYKRVMHSDESFADTERRQALWAYDRLEAAIFRLEEELNDVQRGE